LRRAAKVDANQKEIVSALRVAGATVEHLHAVGKGCPDLLIGYKGFNYLIEVKDGTKTPSQRRLTPDQVKWHANWFGQKIVIESVGSALSFIHEIDNR
jgi:Holliday junction resolvase